MNLFSRWFRKPAVTLKWSVQYADRFKGSALYHFGTANGAKGRFEIFEDGSNFLLHFPRAMRRPAELYHSLESAKSVALCALQSNEATNVE